MARRIRLTIFRYLLGWLRLVVYFLLQKPQGEPGSRAVPENVGGALSSTRPDEHGLVQLHPGLFTGRKFVRRLRLHAQLFPGNIVVDQIPSRC